jgi:hypothetical protein
MAKSTVPYWNVLTNSRDDQWEIIEGTEGLLAQLTLAIDPESGDYTRLTRFQPGADTQDQGVKSHDYPEEILILKGRLYDAAWDLWLEAGDYASRPPRERHGPFKTDVECIVLEISYPSQAMQNGDAYENSPKQPDPWAEPQA